MIIFLVSGLWHGANWTFIVWGAFHGLLFLPLILLGKNRNNLGVVADNRRIPTLKELFQILYTFLLVMIGWVIFRAPSINDAWQYLVMSVSINESATYSIGPTTTILSTVVMIILMLIIDWTQRHKTFGLQIVEGMNIVVRWGVYAALLFMILIFAGQQEQFIYFQF